MVVFGCLLWFVIVCGGLWSLRVLVNSLRPHNINIMNFINMYFKLNYDTINADIELKSNCDNEF